MRVLQIIDSLHAGGAERMAVNYANALVDKIEFSGILVTREQGSLQDELHEKVTSFFINRKKTVDIKALFLFKKIIKNNNINIIHVHGTSFFIAFLVKLMYWKIKIVFHEHNGNRANQTVFKNIPLLICCLFFNQILVVNQQIESWFVKKGFNKCVFFPNFPSINFNKCDNTNLFGEKGKRIVCLANLKNPKNHAILIKSFSQLKPVETGWSLHLVGKNYNDAYSEELYDLINKFSIQNSVFLYDSKSDIAHILSQASIGVLCSKYEGFPVTLLEYGLSRLAVVASNVGFCPEIILHEQTGLVFNPNITNELVFNLQKLLNDEKLRTTFGNNLFELVNENYSQVKIISKLLEVYKNEK